MQYDENGGVVEPLESDRVRFCKVDVNIGKAETKNKTEREKKENSKTIPAAISGAMRQLPEKYHQTRDEIQVDCANSKMRLNSPNTERYKTKADATKAVWEGLPKLTWMNKEWIKSE